MKRFLFLATILFFLYQKTMADVVIIAANSDGDDEFVFVVTASGGLASGSTIFFTDDEYDNTTDDWVDDNEGKPQLVTSANLPQGTTVIVDPTAETAVNANGGASVGTISNVGNYNHANGVDPIYAYTTTDNSPSGVIDNICSVFTDSTLGANESPTPDYPNAVVIELNSNDDNSAYDPANGTVFASVSDFITAVQTLGNYQQTDGSGDQSIDLATLFDGVTFTLAPAPEVPTLSQWGLINLALLFMICGTLYLIEGNHFLKQKH